MVDSKRFVNKSIEKIRDEVDGKAMIALSGGVDSSVCVELCFRAIGDLLHPVFIDTGLMREGEVKQIKKTFEHTNLKVYDRSERFLDALSGVTDPEEKRIVIGELFIRVFEEIAKEEDFDYLIQGTIKSDLVESEDGVKSHHNVGGLPDKIDFKGIIEPVKELYKSEVREVGRELELPEKICNRMPFPGPGLSIRVLGDVTRNKLSVVRKANAIIEEELMDLDPWQAFGSLLGKGTGIKNDERVYGWVISIRAVKSKDAMKAEAMEIPWDKLKNTGKKIVDEVNEVSRVVYDVTDKPPATIEYE